MNNNNSTTSSDMHPLLTHRPRQPADPIAVSAVEEEAAPHDDRCKECTDCAITSTALFLMGSCLCCLSVCHCIVPSPPEDSGDLPVKIIIRNFIRDLTDKMAVKRREEAAAAASANAV